MRGSRFLDLMEPERDRGKADAKDHGGGDPGGACKRVLIWAYHRIAGLDRHLMGMGTTERTSHGAFCLGSSIIII